MAQDSVVKNIRLAATSLIARPILPASTFPPRAQVAGNSTRKLLVARLRCLLVVLLPLSSCVVPIQTGETTVQGRYVQDGELQSIEQQGATRAEIEQQLGPPTVWFERQRILVYGLVKSDSGALWMIPGYPAAAVGFIEFIERDAFFFAIDAEGKVEHSGRRPVPLGATWLEAALEWSREAGFEVPAPRSEFIGESAGPDDSMIVIYRPRDNQYILPFSPPRERLLFNFEFFGEVYIDSVLIAQLRSRTYFSVRLPAGSHTVFVSPYADYNPMIEYRSASVDLETEPGTTYYIDMRMEAGKGYIGPIIQNNLAETATPLLTGLRETW